MTLPKERQHFSSNYRQIHISWYLVRRECSRELHATLDKLRKEGAREGSWSISRFKGLGEMSAEQLWETTLNPETRRLLQVGFGAAGPLAVTQSLTRLMGKGEAAARRELMELHGDSVEVDV